MSLERADHNEHESFGVSTQGELEQVGELEDKLVSGEEINVEKNIPCCSGMGCDLPPCLGRELKSHRPES